MNLNQIYLLVEGKFPFEVLDTKKGRNVTLLGRKEMGNNWHYQGSNGIMDYHDQYPYWELVDSRIVEKAELIDHV